MLWRTAIVVVLLSACTGSEDKPPTDGGSGDTDTDADADADTDADADADADSDADADTDADTDTDTTVKLDDDGDGLTNGEEAALGTDPLVADSDGDGFDDGDEVAGNTDPLDVDDKPYAGGWPIDACRDSIVATGTSVGDIAEDFVLVDQNGENLHLHDFCDKTVLLVSAAFW